MGKLILNVVVVSSSYCSIAGLYISIKKIDDPYQWWEIALLFGLCISFIYLLWQEISEFLKNSPKIYKDVRGINDYLYNWISQNGRIVIFTRDMSWSHSAKMKQLLMNKAAADELTIFLHSYIPVSQELKNAGATIITYGHLNHIPKSRFTILGFERVGSRVAVGIATEDGQMIREYDSGSDPYFFVAEDLVRFLTAAGEKI